jgi:uncharacterized protein (TIGR02996 family)
MKKDGERLIEAIRAAPEDDAARLVYADWLSERGDAMGEMIAIACRKKRTPAQTKVLTRLQAEVEQGLKKLGVDDVRWERGFVRWIQIAAFKLVKNLDAVFAAAPLVSDLRVFDANAARLATLVGSPHMRGIVRLSVHSKYEGPVGGKGAAALAASPHVAGLRALRCDGHLGGWNLGPLGVKALLAPGRLRLAALSLSTNRIGDRGVAALAASPFLATIERLRLDDCEIGDAGVRALAESKHAGALRVLALGGAFNGVRVDGFRALGESKKLARLEIVDLKWSSHIGDDALRALLDAKRLPALRAIDASGTRASRRVLAELKRRFPMPAEADTAV